MKVLNCFLTAAAVMLLGAGCFSPSNTVVTEFDSAGNITRRTETHESVLKSLTESTKNKTVIAWESGWMAYISLAMATADDQTPHAKMFAGKADKGVFSIQKDQKNWDGIAKAILATKQDINVSSSGISSTSSTSAASEKSAITHDSTNSDKTTP